MKILNYIHKSVREAYKNPSLRIEKPIDKAVAKQMELPDAIRPEYRISFPSSKRIQTIESFC